MPRLEVLRRRLGITAPMAPLPLFGHLPDAIGLRLSQARADAPADTTRPARAEPVELPAIFRDDGKDGGSTGPVRATGTI
ncbi:MAG: hypothetical protein DI605_18510 [Sphingomonas sp.]|nr:MAG: hypothetical protein DI605_18510 [Sphingomonas sp.]